MKSNYKILEYIKYNKKFEELEIKRNSGKYYHKFILNRKIDELINDGLITSNKIGLFSHILNITPKGEEYLNTHDECDYLIKDKTVNLNAKQAREIVNSRNINELQLILIDIENKSNQGEYNLHIYKSLKDSTIKELLNRGFNVINHPSIANQKDGLYYTISW